MTDDDKTPSSAMWPQPKFHFEVTWGDCVMRFQEVSGLDTEAEQLEYRHGERPQFSVTRMPGLMKHGRVTMKKGVFKADDRFWDWFNAIKTNTIERQSVTIRLMDERGAPTMTWTLQGAWPTKISGTDLNAQGHEVAVETLDIAHEGLTLATS